MAAILDLLGTYLRVKMGGWKLCSFIPLGMQYPGIDSLRIKQHKNWLCGFARGVSKISGKKKNNHVGVILYFTHLPIFPHWDDHFDF